ncbi:MAG: FHA domain-containing protein [Deltaproteobacteria bacterium]|nr:FHA domain-containing protein [Deltaproteobacteria bacterium]
MNSTQARLIPINSDNGNSIPVITLGHRVTIGRAPGNIITINDRELSKFHAEIVADSDGFVLCDLSSSNGTFVNGKRIQRHRLVEGDVIIMGANQYSFVPEGSLEKSIAAVAILPESPIDKTKVIATSQGDVLASAQAIEDIEALRQAHNHVRAAFAAVRSLLETTDLRALCEKILEVTFSLLKAETGALLLFDDNHQLVPWAHRNYGVANERIIISRTIVEEVMRRRTAVLASDALTDSRWGSAQSVVMSGVRSLMCVPLTSANNVYGLLHVGNSKEIGAFGATDLELISGIGVGAGLALSNAYLTHQLKEEASFREFLGRFLSPMVVEQVMSRKIELKRGGSEAEVTVMFADIRGFTSLTERSKASDVVNLLNEYFEQMVEVVFRYSGILDKFIGDALMAVWGTPVSTRDDAARALKAACEMQEVVESYNAVRSDRGQEPIAIGIGLASGRCVSGAIGARRRMEYTVIGDAVNVASRLAGLATAGNVLCDDETFRRARSPQGAQSLAPTQVKGRSRPVKIFDVTAT